MKHWSALAIFVAPAVLVIFVANPAIAQYEQINLVSDQPGVAHYTDPNLLDPWSLVFALGGHVLMTDAHSGLDTLYGPGGKPTPMTITVPPAPSQPFGPSGTPTGLVMNLGTGFEITEDGKSGPALFLFNTLDGWRPHSVQQSYRCVRTNLSTTSAPSAIRTRLPT